MPPTLMRLVLFLCLGLPSVSAAQSADSTNYFPLEEGNRWEFATWGGPGRYDYYKVPWGTAEVYADTLISDTLYTRATYPYIHSSLFRTDSLGRVWTRMKNQSFASKYEDLLLFDVTLPHGSVYTFLPPGDFEPAYVVEVSHVDSFHVYSGRFNDVIKFTLDIPNASDARQVFALAPNVGLIVASSGMEPGLVLYAAYIGGEVITAVTPERSVPGDALAYPNPFAERVRLRLPVRARPDRRARVYDLLGRSVAALPPERCDAGHCEYVWDGGGLPNGVYFVRADDGHVLRVVLSR